MSAQRVCLYPVPENPQGICGKELSGRGRWKWCGAHDWAARLLNSRLARARETLRSVSSPLLPSSQEKTDRALRLIWRKFEFVCTLAHYLEISKSWKLTIHIDDGVNLIEGAAVIPAADRQDNQEGTWEYLKLMKSAGAQEASPQVPPETMRLEKQEMEAHTNVDSDPDRSRGGTEFPAEGLNSGTLGTSHGVYRQASRAHRLCLFSSPESPQGICGQPLHGRGRSKYCEQHSQIARDELRRKNNKYYVQVWRRRQRTLRAAEARVHFPVVEEGDPAKDPDGVA